MYRFCSDDPSSNYVSVSLKWKVYTSNNVIEVLLGASKILEGKML